MTLLHALPLRLAALAAAALLSLASAPAGAERADRSRPLEINADRQGSIDMQKQVIVFTGNVEITKGSLKIRADRVELREGADGFRTAVATGSSRPATFRQKRDGVDEYIDGQADRLEYEERRELVRFIDNAVVRRMRGSSVGDEITGNLITYDGTSEVFNVSGGTAPAGGASAAAGTGRVRAVLQPRAGSEAAAAAAESATRPAPAASGPAPGDRR
jgi:lipopolysaccharide export system protein LptA